MTARLDERAAEIEEQIGYQLERLAADGCPVTREELLTPLPPNYQPPWSRRLREVEAKQARLALFDWALTEMDRLLADDDAEKVDQGAAIGCCGAARTGVKLDAAVYSDHPDYRDEWKP
jgi:hypothetical protein